VCSVTRNRIFKFRYTGSGKRNIKSKYQKGCILCRSAYDCTGLTGSDARVLLYPNEMNCNEFGFWNIN
jgi:hypothetical protein